jgi:hypothetical protein
MNLPLLLLVMVLAYLLGSVATAVWVERYFTRPTSGTRQRKRRSHKCNKGSGLEDGGAGASYRCSQGWVGAMLPVFLNMAEEGSAMITNYQIIAGLATVVGISFPFSKDSVAVRSCDNIRSASCHSPPGYHFVLRSVPVRFPDLRIRFTGINDREYLFLSCFSFSSTPHPYTLKYSRCGGHCSSYHSQEKHRPSS